MAPTIHWLASMSPARRYWIQPWGRDRIIKDRADARNAVAIAIVVGAAPSRNRTAAGPIVPMPV